jgi:hypothetical protein
MLSGLIQDLEKKHTDLDDTGLPPFDVDRLLREDYAFVQDWSSESEDWNPEEKVITPVTTSSPSVITSDPSVITSDPSVITSEDQKDPKTPEFDPALSLTHVRITIIAPRAKLAVMSAILDRWDEDPEVRISMTDARS